MGRSRGELHEAVAIACWSPPRRAGRRRAQRWQAARRAFL